MAESFGVVNLTKRFDNVLQKHLLKHKDKLTFDHLELLKELKNKKKEREEFGIRIYDVQNRIKRRNEILQSLTMQFDDLIRNRDEFEKALDTSKCAAAETQDIVDAEQIDVLDLLHQIEVLNAEIFKLLSARDSLKANAKVLDQSSIKTVTERRQLETIKANQEDYINHFVEIIEKLQENIVTHDLQLSSTNDECEAIKRAQSQTKMEGEVINIESKNLIKQWDSAVKVLHKRDETLSALTQDNNDHQKLIEGVKYEKRLVVKTLENLEDTNNELNIRLGRLDATAIETSNHLAVCFSQKEDLLKEILSLKCEIDRAQLAITLKTQEKSLKEKELISKEKCVQAAFSKMQSLNGSLKEELIIRNVTDGTSQKVLKQIDNLQRDKITKEQERGSLERELLTLELEIEDVHRETENLNLEIKEVELTIDMNETEIKKMRRKIQLNAAIVDKSIKEANSLQADIDKYSFTSLENTTNSYEIEMRSLVKALEENLNVEDKLKMLWRKQQNELVHISREKEASLEEGKLLENQLVVYRQRNRNLKTNVQNVSKESKDLEKRIENFYRQISTLNKTVFEETNQEADKINATLDIENQLLITLEDKENLLADKFQLIEQLKNDGLSLREKIKEAEENLKHWEMKLQETKATKFLVEAEYKEGEMGALKENLHKMKVHYSTICKHRGLFAKEFERSISRWDTLLTKSGVYAASVKNKNAASANNCLSRQLDNLKKKFQNSEMDLKSMNKYAHDLDQRKIEIEKNIKDKTIILCDLKSVLQANSIQVASTSYEKTLIFEELILVQQILKCYEDIKHFPTKYTPQPKSHLKREIEKTKQKASELKDLLDEIDKKLINSEWSQLAVISKVETLKLRMEALINYLN